MVGFVVVFEWFCVFGELIGVFVFMVEVVYLVCWFWGYMVLKCFFDLRI